MTKRFGLFLFLLVAVPACIPKSFQKELAGPIPVLVANQGSLPIGVYIGPKGSEGGPAPWGELIPPGGNATFNVKAGSYAIVMKGMKDRYISTFIGKMFDVQGPMSFVVADAAIAVPPEVTLMVSERYVSEDEIMSRALDGEYNAPPGQCQADGTETDSFQKCCGGKTMSLDGESFSRCCSSGDKCG